MQGLSIASDFSDRFEFVIADTPALRAQVFALRYRVFCEEFGYNMENSNGAESDIYDPLSTHVLLRRKHTHLPVGCFRIVQSQLSLADWLPFEHYGVPNVSAEFNWGSVDRRTSVEVSRLALAATTRAGRADAAEKRPADAYLVTAMFFAVTGLIAKQQRDHVFMFIEPRLGRLTARYGIKLDQISPIFDYCGPRAIFVSTGQRMAAEPANYKPAMRELFDVVQRQLFGNEIAAEVA